ncbi:MAG: glycosidase, partial [Candidatus Omnitrophica bacterium]|nr:glycosidase [Candidatus Omnitrophota bacterium]
FTCGCVEKDGQLLVYYGAADTVIGVAYADMKDVLGLF